MSVQLFNGETQHLTITLENIGSEDLETLEVASKTCNTKGQGSDKTHTHTHAFMLFLNQ